MKIQIVNEQDQVIGVKERSELDYSKDIYRVSALWLVNSAGKALLAKRASNKDKDPGLWGPAVAGTVDEGETYEDNIYKEAQEEIGLTGVPFTSGKKMRFSGDPRHYFCQWYFVTVDLGADEFTLQESEVDEVAWVDVETMTLDLQQNPEKYIPTMIKIVEELGI